MTVPFVTGVNYPWSIFNDQPNYGCDFGVNVWGGHSGVTAHTADIRQDFYAMAAIGIDVVRWFVFTDGRGGVRWDANGRAAGLADGVFEDMDAALEIAGEVGLRLCLVLFDYSWMMPRVARDGLGAPAFATQPEALRTDEGRARLLDGLLDPLLARYGTPGRHAALGNQIHSIDVINEPDWVTVGLAGRQSFGAGGRDKYRPFSRAELRGFVRDVARRVHRDATALVTVGGARVRNGGEWDDPAYDLDFLQIHSYPDIRHPRRDLSAIGRPCQDLALTKPVLIGEFPANSDRQHPRDHHPPSFSLTDYLNLGRDGGYLGAWPWSFKGVDACGALNAEAMQAWISGQRRLASQ